MALYSGKRAGSFPNPVYSWRTYLLRVGQVQHGHLFRHQGWVLPKSGHSLAQLWKVGGARAHEQQQRGAGQQRAACIE